MARPRRLTPAPPTRTVTVPMPLPLYHAIQELREVRQEALETYVSMAQLIIRLIREHPEIQVLMGPPPPSGILRRRPTE